MTQFALSVTSISVLPVITEAKVGETSKKGNWGRKEIGVVTDFPYMGHTCIERLF